jgi:sugar phosphate permease
MQTGDIQDKLKHGQPMRHYPEAKAWFIWSFAGLFYGYQFILRVSPSVMTDDLMRDFSVEACTLGILSAFYYYSYSSLQLPLGLSMDKFGPSRLLRAAVLLVASGALLFSLSDSIFVAGLGRLLIGAGSSAAFLGSLKLATLWFHPERLALVVGFTLLAGKLGAAIGQGPLALLVDAVGWRPSMMIVAGVGLILSVGIWIFVSDTPPITYGVTPVKTDTRLSTLFSRLKDIVADYRIWILGLYGSLTYVPLSAFADLWGVPFLVKMYDIDNATASSATTMLFIGAGIGAPIVALVSDFFRSRKWPMIISAALAIVVNGVIIFVPGISLQMMFGLLFAAGFIFAAQPLIFSAACRLTPKASNGTVVSFTNMIVMMSGVALQPLVGWMLDWAWDGVRDNGIPLYTLDDYRFALSSVLVCLVISLMITPLIPETFPKKYND